MWKQIDGYENYSVSDKGEVKSEKTGIVLKPWVQQSGYASVSLWKDGKKKNVLVHRLVAEAFVDNPCGYSEVNHIDEVKGNNSATNLEWCTRKYNMNYGSIKAKQSACHKGQTPWCKGKKCPQLSAAMRGKPHPHIGGNRKKGKENSAFFNRTSI